MIVLCADTHKRSHTVAAVSATSGELLGEQTVLSGAKGTARLLRWARGLGTERVSAIEDCRHISGSLERFLIERGERVLRVHSALTAGVAARSPPARQVRPHRRARRRPGRVARRARHVAGRYLDGLELDLRLLVDHRERLVRARVAVNNTLRWHLHDLWPDLQFPGSALFYGNWGPRIARRLARAEQTTRVRIARDELRRLRELTQTIKSAASRDHRPHRPDRPAPADRAQFRLTRRHRLDRGGNRQINATIHRIITRLSCHPETKDYIARNAPKARAPKTPSAASSATSRDASGTCSRLQRLSRTRRSHPHLIDIGAAKAIAGLSLCAGRSFARKQHSEAVACRIRA